MINIKMQPESGTSLTPKIAVLGIGGAGGNAVNNMISSNLEGCEFVVCNTDAQALNNSLSENKIQLGEHVTGGLGAGSVPQVGQAAAEESLEEVLRHVEGANMAFITAGMGGGTGTGAAPVIAKACREQGILTVGVVTKPFHFEGAHRMEQAEKGIQELQQYVDTLIVIPNQNLFRIANEKTTFAEAFKMADSVLQSGVRGVTDLMVRPGLVNLDFADIRTAMLQMGKAMMGTGEASGEKRAIEAAESAINNPLLDDVSMKGAQGVIINVTGGYDMTLFEADEACNRIRDEVDPNANIIFGATFDDSMEGIMRVSIVATGIEREAKKNKVFGGGSSGGGGGGGIRTIRPAPVEAEQSADVTVQEAAPVEQDRAREAAKAPAMSPSAAISGREAVRSIKAPSPITSGMQNKEASPLSSMSAPQPTRNMPEESIDMFEQGSFAGVGNAGQGSAPIPHNTALRGTTYNNAFIPPRPMEADVFIPENGIGSHISSFHGAHVAAHQVSEEAAGAAPGLKLNPPAPSARVQKRSQSLFERITGTVQHTLESLRDDGSDEVAPTESVSMRSDNLARAPRIAPPAPAQGTLNISAPAGKPASAMDEELDIPAFLRRQAN
ncbi:MAG: cell division protein FtsZ [Alphaproteobacteria bacterium]|nr:cell division protein FtsZ [Alphaproteobacteria bacterium]